MPGHPGLQRSDKLGAETSRAGRVRVLVADDHPAMRRALARLVIEHASLELVGEATDGVEAIELVEAAAPDVAVVDVRMPNLDGLALVKRLQAQCSPVRVLFISGYDDRAIVNEAIAQGGAGFLSKECDESEICEAIIAVASGRAVLSLGALDDIRRRTADPVSLSGRERELLELAAGGATSAQIAERLCLSPNTVKTYWQRLYEKLGASDRANAIAEAIRRGLLA